MCRRIPASEQSKKIPEIPDFKPWRGCYKCPSICFHSSFFGSESFGKTIAVSCFLAAEKAGHPLVGLGQYSANQLAPALQETENCYLAGIVTGTPSKIDVWKELYDIPDKNIYNYVNFDEIASNEDIDGVYSPAKRTACGIHDLGSQCRKTCDL